jgi:polysaccharide deacetylase family protein (PEP-CTERM system associated)
MQTLHILTFDIEEWFHILDFADVENVDKWENYEVRIDQNVDRILELLDSGSLKATFFCLGWIAKKHPHVIRRIYKSGMEIASHSNFHTLAYQMSPWQFREDLKMSIETLEDCIGSRINIFRAPGFSLTEQNTWVFEELAMQGIQIDCSIFPAKRAHGGFEKFGPAQPVTVVNSNGLQIKEFPINTVEIGQFSFVFSGGGYFRLMPYPLIRLLFQKSPYVMTYFHPRDFDPHQPMLKNLKPLRKIKSYIGLKGATKKLKRLISDFQFTTIGKADRMINWKKVPQVSLF